VQEITVKEHRAKELTVEGEKVSETAFGLSIAPSVAAGTDPVASARMAEDLGFDFVSASDHPCGTQPTYETWTLLSWIAAATSRIRVATRVLGVPYRNPAMTAKMAETFSRLSGGRLILGLGGGYSDDEFRAFGLGTFAARDKVDGLGEAVVITRGLWSQREFSFDGRLHRTDRAELEPKPLQPIPIWLGTFGDRALQLTGQLADGWIPSYGDRPLQQYKSMRERVLTAARDAGRDPAAVTCALHLQAQIGDRAGADPSLVAGPPAAVTEQLLAFTAIGFTAFSVNLTGPGLREQAEKFAFEVIPAVRAAG
jgi:alkanesulfonate monooxygenase SsuD/methylene tetrahydromethanopterin reductase-like flavin-dependent oxidoreductase (luciferase family)